MVQSRANPNELSVVNATKARSNRAYLIRVYVPQKSDRFKFRDQTGDWDKAKPYVEEGLEVDLISVTKGSEDSKPPKADNLIGINLRKCGWDSQDTKTYSVKYDASGENLELMLKSPDGKVNLFRIEMNYRQIDKGGKSAGWHVKDVEQHDELNVQWTE